MLRVFPVGLAAAPVANQLALHVNLRKQLCKPYCIDSSIQPFSSVTYTAGTPILNGTTVFVPITARVSITVPETASVNYANHLMIASDQNSLLPELQSLADESEKIIAAAPAHEERLKKIKELQVELNPQAKREQEYDKRLAAIEKSQQEMAAMITNFIKELKS